MENALAATIQLLGVSGGTYVLGLVIHNGTDRRLLLPVPEVTCFRFARLPDRREAEWYTKILQSSPWQGVVLNPSASHKVTYHAVPQRLMKRGARDESDQSEERWCVDLEPGDYEVALRMTVDADYFDGDSHWRMPHLQRRAEAENAEVWTGELRSNVLRIAYGK